MQRQQWRNEFFVQRPAAKCFARQRGLWLGEWRCCFNRTDGKSLHCWYSHDSQWDRAVDLGL
jgi:hypothetical protein